MVRHLSRTLAGLGPALLLLPFLTLADAGHLWAQDGSEEWRAPRWVGDMTFVSTNALLGGLTGGVLQRLNGGEFRDGFARGALGGGTAYLGRRVAVEDFRGAGLLGRQISGVGASMVRNAGEGRPALEQLVFPLGPIRLQVDRAETMRITPRVALHDLAWTLTFAMQPETELDWTRSLSAGAPVFRSPLRRFIGPDGDPADGVAIGGVIGLSDVPEDRLRTVFSHERVHVLQHDFAFLVWSDPVEARIMDRTDWGRTLYRYLDLGMVFPAVRGGVNRAFGVEHEDQLSEIEAKFLDGGVR